MTADDVDAKFTSACRGVISDERREQLRSAWWGIDQAERIGDICTLMADYDRKPELI
jgi:hypothetical protein